MADSSLQTKKLAISLGVFSTVSSIFLTITSVHLELGLHGLPIENGFLGLGLLGFLFLEKGRSELYLPFFLVISMTFLSSMVNHVEWEMFSNPEYRSFLRSLILGILLVAYSRSPHFPWGFFKWALVMSFLVFTVIFLYHYLILNEVRAYDERPLVLTKNGDPNFAAVFFGFGIFVLWSFRETFLYFLSLPLAIALLLTQSRMGVIAFSLGALLFIRSLLPKFFILMIILFLTYQTGTYKRILKINDTSNRDRLSTFENAMELVERHPFLGVGWNQSPYTYFEHGFDGPFRAEAQRLHTHNTFLQILSEHGVLGLSIFVTFLFSVGSSGFLFPALFSVLLNALTLPLQNKDFFWTFIVLSAVLVPKVVKSVRPFPANS